MRSREGEAVWDDSDREGKTIVTEKHFREVSKDREGMEQEADR